MSRLYEFGGVADVLIKCKTGCQIGGRAYKAGEPYTLIPDVQIALSYDQKIHTTEAKMPILATQNAKPTDLVITGVCLTNKIRDLVMTKMENLEPVRTKATRVYADDNGTIELESTENIWLYCADCGLAAEYEADDTILKGLEPNREYLLFAPEKLDLVAYNLEIPHFPYFELEVLIKGNVDKRTSNIFMKFDAASLITAPNFDAGIGTILETPLVFELIYKNQKEPYIAMR